MPRPTISLQWSGMPHRPAQVALADLGLDASGTTLRIGGRGRRCHVTEVKKPVAWWRRRLGAGCLSVCFSPRR
eukprot:359841-Chlamydomonas_euryale.AAC.5